MRKSSPREPSGHWVGTHSFEGLGRKGGMLKLLRLIVLLKKIEYGVHGDFVITLGNSIFYLLGPVCVRIWGHGLEGYKDPCASGLRFAGPALNP